MKTIKQGDKGRTVRFAQTRLKAHGFFPHEPDGVFGPATRGAVLQFQAAHGLVDDGIVGDRTWTMLRSRGLIQAPDDVLSEQREWMRDQITGDWIGERRDVLYAAIDTLGWKEMPDGSNGGPAIDLISGGYYDDATELKLGKPPWCALAVSFWLLRGLKAQDYKDIPFGARLGAVSQIEKWATGKGNWHRAGAMEKSVEAGSIFTMGRAGSGSDVSSSVHAGHTGLTVADLGEEVLTIEGNTGNAVMARKRLKRTLRMFIEWWG